jgi:hypothetical protein
MRVYVRPCYEAYVSYSALSGTGSKNRSRSTGSPSVPRYPHVVL